jgi:hypothetical protein
MGDAKFGHQIIKRSIAFVIMVFKCFKNGADILFNRQAAKDARFLWQISHAKTRTLENGHSSDISSINKDLPLIGGQ